MITRTAAVFALAVVLCMLGNGLLLEATPIRPDPRNAVRQQDSPDFVPARAGWDGPGERGVSHPANPLLESISPERVNSDFQETVLSLVIPDARLVVALTVLIFLMRRLLKIDRKRPRRSGEIPSRERAAA